MNLRKDSESIYIKYHRIPDYAWHEKIAFYQAHEPDFVSVDKSQRREIEIDYIIALFEVGKYDRFLSIVDPLIEAVIAENIYSYEGKDIFSNLLFRKAACLFNLGQYNGSMIISKQLINIDKKDKTYKHLLAKAQFKVGRKWYDIFAGSAVILLLFAICAFLLEIFIIEPFYGMHLAAVINMKYTLFGLSAILIIGNEIAHRAKWIDL